MSGRRIAMALVAALVVATPVAAQHSKNAQPAAEKEDDLLWAKPDDPAVEAAKAEARRTLPVFWRHLEAQDRGESNFIIKVGLADKNGGQEHIWAYVMKRDDRSVVVRLANEPFYLPGLKYGSEVTTPLSTISDWSYKRDGKLYGHFTTRVMLDRASPDQRAQLQAMLSATPLQTETP